MATVGGLALLAVSPATTGPGGAGAGTPLAPGAAGLPRGMAAEAVGFAALAAITFIVLTAIWTKLAWGKILVSTLVAAFVVWAVTMNGLGWFSSSIDSEVTSAPAVSVVIGYDLAA